MGNRKRLVLIAWISGVAAFLAIIVMSFNKTSFFNAGVGRSIYVFDLCAGQDDLWVVYPTKWDLSEFSIYSHGKEERGTETRPRIKGRPKWNPHTERFYYLSGKRLMEYDPVTGAVEKYKLEQKYQLISAMEGNVLILQPEYGADIYHFSIETKQETKLDIAGVVTSGKLYDGCLLFKRRLSHDRISRELTCYDYQESQELWTKDVESLFPSAVSPAITIADGQVWVWAKNPYTLHAADIRTGEFIPTETKNLLYATGTEHGLLCAGRTLSPSSAFNEVGFYMLHSDGTQTPFGNFKAEGRYNLYHLYDPIRMALFQGKVYCALVESEDSEVYCCDLP